VTDRRTHRTVVNTSRLAVENRGREVTNDSRRSVTAYTKVSNPTTALMELHRLSIQRRLTFMLALMASVADIVG